MIVSLYTFYGDIMSLFLLCIKIFFVRIIDVSLGTLRTVVTIKGNIKTASFIGFFEVLVWFLVVKEALNTASNSIFIGISYALGFACGTYIGGIISSRFIDTSFTLEVITSHASKEMIKAIRDNGYGVSIIKANGSNNEEKELLFISIEDDHYYDLKNLIATYDKDAFIVVNENKYVLNGYFKERIIK